MDLVLFIANDWTSVVRLVSLVTHFTNNLNLDVFVDIVTVIITNRRAAISARVGPTFQILHLHIIHYSFLALVKCKVRDRVRRGGPASSPALMTSTAKRTKVGFRVLVSQFLLRTHRRDEGAEDR